MNVNEAREQLDENTKQLDKKALELTRNERNKAVNEIIENYFEITGKYPDTYRLGKLTNIILVEEIKDKRRNKTLTTEYGFLSPRQQDTRARKETAVDDDSTINFLYQKNVKKLSSTFRKRTSEGSLND